MKKGHKGPALTFRNKYLAVMTILALFSGSLFAQDSTRYSRINGYGFGYKRHIQDSVSVMPLATSPHNPYRAGGYRFDSTNRKLQLWYAGAWYDYGKAVQLTDSTFKVGVDTILIRGTGGGGGSGTVTNVATGYGLSGGPITTTGTLLVDSATLSSYYLRRKDSLLYVTQTELDDSTAAIRADITGGGGSPGTPDSSFQFRTTAPAFGGSNLVRYDSSLTLYPALKYNGMVPSRRFGGLVYRQTTNSSIFSIKDRNSFDSRFGNWYDYVTLAVGINGGTIPINDNLVWSNGYNLGPNGDVDTTKQSFGWHYETNFPTGSDSVSYSEFYFTHKSVRTGNPSILGGGDRVIFIRGSNGFGSAANPATRYKHDVFMSMAINNLKLEWQDSVHNNPFPYFSAAFGGVSLIGNKINNSPAINISLLTNPNSSTLTSILNYNSNPILSVATDTRRKIQIGGNSNGIIIGAKEMIGNPGAGTVPFYINQEGAGVIQIGVKDVPDASKAHRIMAGSFGLGYVDSTNVSLSTNVLITRPDNDVRMSISHTTTYELPAFTIMKFGGLTDANPALKRSSALLQVRAGDDTKHAFIEAKGEAYGAGWDGDSALATKADLYNKIEGLSGVGEVNTASSAGGTSIYKTKTGVDLIFKGLTAPASVTVTSNTNDLALQLSGDNAAPGNSQYYGTNGSGTKGFYALPSGSSPAGSTTNIQYNNAGAFAGTNDLVWDNTNTRLGIGVTSPLTTLHLSDPTPVFRMTNDNDGSSTSFYGLNGGEFGINMSSSGWGLFINSTGKVGIGNNTSPGAWLHLPAGTATAGTAPLRFTSGTNLTTPVAGSMEYNGTSLFFSPSTTRLRTVLTDNSIPANGQIPIGNGVNYTNANITSTGGTVTVTNGAGTINLDIPATVSSSGNYTATLTNGTNVEASTFTKAHYYRTGNHVVVYIQVSVNPTTTTFTELAISLPIASNIAASGDIIGFGNCSGFSTQSATIGVDSSNDRALLQYTATDVNDQIFFITFSYEIL